MHERAYDEAVARAAGRDVLDVGCNTGYGTVRLATVARHAVGVDVSPLAIEEARRRPGAGGADFAATDGTRLPFPDESFDLVASFQVIEHVAEPAPYLAEIARVLRPDGTALFTTPNAAIRLDPGMPPWNRFHVREYQAADLGAVLSTVFGSVEVRGMFASPGLYHIEFSRVDAARRRHTATILAARSMPWRRRLRACLCSRVGRLWAVPRSSAPSPREAGPRPTPSPEAGAPASRSGLGPLSTADFWYALDDLGRALDLLAVCRAAGAQGSLGEPRPAPATDSR
jgi:SAM-dependent methyltransferase